MQKDARRFHHLRICIDVRFTTKNTDFPLMKLRECQVEGSIFGERCRVTEIRKIQQNDHHSISILSSYISNPFTMCSFFAETFHFTSPKKVQQSQEQLARSIELTKEQMPELLQRIRRGRTSHERGRHLLGFPSRLSAADSGNG